LILAVVLLAAAAAGRAVPLDPGHWFASRPGLVRIYEGRTSSGNAPAAGASCEVLAAQPRDSLSDGSLIESCTMIVDRKAKPSAELTYVLRPDGIWNTAVKAEGGVSQSLQRLVLPAPLSIGSSWKEPRGTVELNRVVRSAGRSCKAAGRSFADCLVLSVVEKTGNKVTHRYSETYAAGVGLVEDAQWQLVDVKGL
jgi:hypothetical protein